MRVCRPDGGALRIEQTGRARELGLAIHQERALGGHFIACLQAGADHEKIVPVFIFETRPEG